MCKKIWTKFGFKFKIVYVPISRIFAHKFLDPDSDPNPNLKLRSFGSEDSYPNWRQKSASSETPRGRKTSDNFDAFRITMWFHTSNTDEKDLKMRLMSLNASSCLVSVDASKLLPPSCSRPHSLLASHTIYFILTISTNNRIISTPCITKKSSRNTKYS